MFIYIHFEMPYIVDDLKKITIFIQFNSVRYRFI